jgi:copper chaperone CopZ
MLVKEFYVQTIHCKHCKETVEEALKSIEGVKKAKVDLDGNAFIKSKEEISEDIITEKIEEAGFKVIF